MTNLRASLTGALLSGLGLLSAQNGVAPVPGPARFEAAHYGHDAVYIFPTVGKAFSIPLPPHVPPTANLIGFAVNGRSLYLQVPSLRMPLVSELIQIDFSPLRLFSVMGSAGLGAIGSVTNSPSGNLIVTAYHGQGLCGAYEIDTSRGTNHPIWTEPAAPDCLHSVQQVGPEGKRLLLGDSMNFKIIDTATGKVELSGSGRGAWSPDGNWLAISANGKITVFDGRTLSKRRRVRASSVDGHLIWSPDSKRILFVQKELGCFLLGDLESIAVLDIDTGTKRVISSSHCMVNDSGIGWIDVGAVMPSTAKK